MNSTILMYNFDKDKAKKIQLICMQMKFRIKVIEKEDYLKPIGAFIHAMDPSEIYEVYQGDAFKEEMLVMAGLNDTQINQLLTSFKRQQIPFINLKAMITPNNILWNSLELREELMAEHEAILEQRTAHEQS